MANVKTDKKTVWQAIDANSLSPELKAHYAKVRAAHDANAKAYKALKDAEDVLTKALLTGRAAPEGKMWKVATKYGLAVALVDAEDTKAKTGTVSLAAWLEHNAA